MRETIEIIVKEALITEELAGSASNSITAETKLFSAGGCLDSIGLVRLIVLVENAIQERLGQSLILANDKAFAMHTSPFSTIATLVDFIVSELHEYEHVC